MQRVAPGDAAPDSVIRGRLTAELDNPRSPVRRFLDERFTAGLRGAQRLYRESAPAALLVPSEGANPGTVGTAADWLLRFLVSPSPDIHLVARGVAAFARAQFDYSVAVSEIAETLGVVIPSRLADPGSGFEGPTQGNQADPEYLARACWAFALITEAYRAGPKVVGYGGPPLTARWVLSIAPQEALAELARFRRVFETTLIPALASWRGRWELGPTFGGSSLIPADADLIAAGLLLDLKTGRSRPALNIVDALQLIGYTLLDFEDEFAIRAVGIFSARYGYLRTWPLDEYLARLADHPIDLPATRAAFREMLLAAQPHRGSGIARHAGSAADVPLSDAGSRCDPGEETDHREDR
ncbi:MAG TPA: hypothetical protein DCX12_10420 [Chloroflexi bacterium]|jgi:hypothetical protein|nr:hypothetical protein [Chloroflexota bacterium]